VLLRMAAFNADRRPLDAAPKVSAPNLAAGVWSPPPVGWIWPPVRPPPPPPPLPVRCSGVCTRGGSAAELGLDGGRVELQHVCIGGVWRASSHSCRPLTFGFGDLAPAAQPSRNTRLLPGETLEFDMFGPRATAVTGPHGGPLAAAVLAAAGRPP
jgi:hypothetical protein